MAKVKQNIAAKASGATEESKDVLLRRYTFKLYPNAAQRASLERQCKLHAWLWNAALQERIDCYRLTGKSLSLYDQQRHLKTVRADDPEYAALSADSLALTLKRLDLAFQAFFRRVKAGAGAEAGFPRYRAADRYDKIPFRDAPKGWRLTHLGGAAFSVYMKGTPGLLRARGRFPAEPEALRDMTILRRDGGWWMSVVVRIAPRRSAGPHPLRVAFDLVDEFARVERADGECLAAAFSDAESGNMTTFPDGCQASASGDPGNGVEGQVPNASRYISAASGDPGNGVEGQAYSRPRLRQPPSGDPGNAVEGQAGRPSPACPSASGDPGNAVDGQGVHRKRHKGHPSGDPGNAVTGQVLMLTSQMRATSVDTGNAVSESQSSRDRRFKRGSRRWLREKKRIARLNATNARRQRDALHRWTTSIVRCAAGLEVIAPAIKEATRSARGDERHHGAAVGLVAMLNRHVLGQAPATAIQMLEYKAAEASIPFVRIVPEKHPVALGRDLPKATQAARKARRLTRKEEA